MGMRFNRNDFASATKGSPLTMQKKVGSDNRRSVSRPAETKEAPDLTDLMNDMFFGTPSKEKKVYNLTGGDQLRDRSENIEEKSEDFDSSTRSTNSRLTQEWLEEARRMVASSPTRSESPSRLGGSPRFAGSQQQQQQQMQPARLSLSTFDRRDPSSRSARRHRTIDGLGGEILTKSSNTHTRKKSQTTPLPESAPPPHQPNDNSPASVVQKWFNNIINKPNSSDPTPPPVPDPNPPLPPRLSTHRRSRFETRPESPPPSVPDPNSQFVPPRQSFHRKSRFQSDPTVTLPQGIPPQPPSKRTFAAASPASANLLSPPKHLTESANRRSISSSTCEKQVLSPPRNLVESAHRRTISSSTCSTDRNFVEVNAALTDLNGFLKEQRVIIGKLLSGEINGYAKIVLSGPSNSTSFMLSAICYAWLLETKMRNDNKEGTEGGDTSPVVVVPVMNLRRGKMWRQRQAAWLFHHVGVDAKALLFSDEVDLEALMMAKKLSILVVGQDILKSSGEVGSQCTVLTDNYCEDAYDLLDNPILKKLLLAGILLDTQNLNVSTKLSVTRDAEAVQLLSVGCAPNYGNALYDQLMQDQRDGSFIESLRHNYGKPPTESNNSRAPTDRKTSERKSFPEATIQTTDKNSNDGRTERTSRTSSKQANSKPVSAQAADSSHGKNKFSIAKWFGFGK